MRLFRRRVKLPPTDPLQKDRETLARGIDAVGEVLKHADEPDFMDRVREVRPLVHEATEAATRLGVAFGAGPFA